MENRAEELNIVIAKKDEEIISIKEKISIYEKEILDIEKTQIENSQIITNLTTSLNEKESLIKEKDILLATIINNLNLLKESHSNSKSEIISLTEQNHNLKEELEQYRNSLSSRNAKIIEVEVLKEELTKVNKEKIEIKEELINLQLKLDDVTNTTKTTIQHLEERIQEYESQLVEKDHELEEFKNLNSRLINQIEEIKSQTQSVSARVDSQSLHDPNIKSLRDEFDEDELRNIMYQVETLKEMIREKDEQIDKITQENDNYKSEIEKILKLNDEGESRSKMSGNLSSLGPINNNNEEFDIKKIQDKLDKYKKIIENYKHNNESALQQMSLLKAEIKNYKNKFNDLQNYDGRIKDYEEFKGDVMKLLGEFKPKKKEYEDIVKRLKEHLTIEIVSHRESSSSVVSSNTAQGNAGDKKKGFLGFFKKGK
jgi:chromosome segregation ATPase